MLIVPKNKVDNPTRVYKTTYSQTLTQIETTSSTRVHKRVFHDKHTKRRR